MRKVSALLIAALVALAPSAEPLKAQDKAADAIAKMRQAIGGGKLDSLRTFSLTAKTARNMGERQMVSDIELYLELPDKYLRVDNLTAPVARTTQLGFNGDKPIFPQGMSAGGNMVIMNGAPMVASGGGGGAAMGQRMMVTEMVVAGGGGGGRGGAPGEAAPNVTPEMRNAQLIRGYRIELSRMMLGWFGTAHPGLNATYTYAGEAESPDGKAHIINVKADGGFEVKLFIDQATNMPLFVSWQALEPIRLNNIGRAGGPSQGGVPPPPPPPPPPPGAAGAAQSHPPVVSNTPAQGQMTDEMRKQLDEAMKNRKMIEYRVYFGDWKDVGGIQFPHMLQRATGNDTTEEWTINKVQVNPKIDAKKFQ